MSENDKFNDLSSRIEKAEAATHAETQQNTEAAKVLGGRNMGMDFIGSVIICGIVGVLADRAFNTEPWCTLGMIFFGFVVGIAGVWRALQKSETKR